MIKVVDSLLRLCTVEEYALPCAMTKEPGWVSAQKAQELLGIDRKTLFKYRDDGTLTLGTHFAAFPGCMSRDGYRWNVAAVRKQLKKIERKQAKLAMEAC